MTDLNHANSIIELCRRNRTAFNNAIKGIKPEIKGILHSEMLLVYSMSNILKAKDIIEGGRARGNSTEVLGRCYHNTDNINILSIEMKRYTEDSLFILKHLYKKYSNINLLFGNANILLPELCKKSESSTVILDGPKGENALLLASVLLKNSNVKAVFIHDTHKDSTVRKKIENIYTNTFSTDHHEYVKEFSDMDKDCWQAYKTWEGHEDWGPYKRIFMGKVLKQSYGPTLTMILNNPSGIDKTHKVLETINQHQKINFNNTKYNALRLILRSYIPKSKSELKYFFSYFFMILLKFRS